MNDQARALLFVAALFGGGGYTGGRVTAPAPPAEVRFVYVPAPAPLAESVPEEAPPVAAPVDRVTRAPLDPPAAVSDPPAVEAKPLPQPRPKIDAKPKPKPPVKPAVTKPRPVRKPTAAECAQLKLGMLTIGRDGVNEKAKARGYTSAQVAWALSACAN